MDVQFTYNDEEQTQKCGDVSFRPFDPVTVQLSLDRSNLQHEKLVFKLVYPHIPGFSVPTLDSAKRKEKTLRDEMGKNREMLEAKINES
ncbi:hypothetical protein L9F63_015656, partial [Diploptera punctata]